MHDIDNWKRILGTAAFLAIVSFGAAPQSARAQNPVAGWAERNDYTVERPKPVSFPERGHVLKEGAFADDEQEKKFAEYYTQTLFPNITDLTNRETRDDVVTRLAIDLRVCERAQPQQVYNKLAQLTLDYMQRKAVDPNQHPAVRLNAMLAIGGLNTDQAAETLLDTVLDRAQFLGLRVAAMSGLARLASPSGRGVLAANPGFGAKVLKSMVMFVKFHPKKGADADGINWIRGQAAEVLAGMASTGASGEVPAALLVMVNDADLAIPLRAKAASALGKLNYNGNPPPGNSYLAALAAFADEALQNVEQILLGDDRAPARVRQIAHDVLEGMKPFETSTNANDVPLIEVLKKALTTLNKETEGSQGSMSTEEFKAAVAKARTMIESVARK